METRGLLSVHFETNRGRIRDENDDVVFVDPEKGLFVLADGGASHQAGKIAAELAVQIISSHVSENMDREHDEIALLRKSVQQANRDIFRQSRQAREFFGMGTTALVALIAGEHCHIAHVGDTRAYLIRENRIERLTEDHSVAGWLVKTGRITEDKVRDHRFRYALTRAVGTKATVDVDVCSLRVEKKDFLLLCTDGLTDALKDDEINKIFQYGAGALDDICAELVRKASEKDDRDDVTALLIAFD